FTSNGGINQIDLVIFKSSSNLISSLQSGKIDCVFTSIPDWSASYISSKTAAVDMNNLVLLGINGQSEPLKTNTLRQVILKAVDQQSLIKDAFKSTAIPTSTPFNPAFYKLDSAGISASTHSPTEIPSMMRELGFTEKDENGMYTGISLKLIVNNESPIKCNAAYAIAQQLGKAGISVTVEESSFEVYMNNLVSQNFDLYIAEIAIPYNMDLSSVLSQHSNSGFGAGYNSTLIDEYTQLRSGAVTCSQFIKIFNEIVPFVPLAYRNGTLALSADFPAEISSTPQDIFYNIDTW
ncbi:MAG: ABC transporter substrate-binding protein, partial [Oscillospiraceae bacterium]